jgi:hypothetical protein
VLLAMLKNSQPAPQATRRAASRLGLTRQVILR